MAKRVHSVPPAHPTYGEYEEVRRRVSADSLDAASVAARLGKVASEVTAHRTAGELLAVWPPSDQRFLYPRLLMRAQY